MHTKSLYLIWIFYKKLIIPSVFVTLVASFFLRPPGVEIHILSSFGLLGFAYFFVSLFFQLLIYELSNPNEYYFYYNLGLRKLHLWLSNAIIGTILFVILILLQVLL